MDFLDPSKKRSHTIRLYIGYVLVGIAILLATIIMLYQANGYSFDSKTRSIIQNGLVFVDVQPEQADIYINNELQRNKTDARLELAAGSYTLKLARSGYRDWQRSFDLLGGTVQRYVYPKLFPTDIQSSQIEVYADRPPMVTQSPDRRWMVLQQPGSLLDFEIRDFSRPEEPGVALQLPADTYTLPVTGTLTAIEWSDDNQNVLLQHSTDNQTEFIVFNREQPTATVNVNRLLAFNPTYASLRDKRSDQLYTHEANGGLVRIADLKARTLSAPILQNVVSYKPHGSDVMVYITTEGAPEGKVIAVLKNGSQTINLRELTKSNDNKYFTDVARYDDHWYYVVGSGAEDKVMIYRDPVIVESIAEDPYVSPYTILRLNGTRFVSFSHNAQFIAAQSGQNFVVYDAEEQQTFRYAIDEPIELAHEAKWMDGHRLVINSNDQATVFDYDGINKQSLGAVAPSMPIMFDRDYDRMYTFSPSNLAPRFVLNRSLLTLENL